MGGNPWCLMDATIKEITCVNMSLRGTRVRCRARMPADVGGIPPDSAETKLRLAFYIRIREEIENGGNKKRRRPATFLICQTAKSRRFPSNGGERETATVANWWSAAAEPDMFVRLAGWGLSRLTARDRANGARPPS